MIFRRGKASYLYNDRQILGDRRGNRENAEPSSRMTPTTLGKLPVPEGTSGKVFPKLTKALASPQSQADSSRGGLNTVFRFWQSSSNSAKPPRPVALWLPTSAGGWEDW